jgi:hypothetical protein
MRPKAFLIQPYVEFPGIMGRRNQEKFTPEIINLVIK